MNYNYDYVKVGGVDFNPPFLQFNDVAASHWASGYINQASNLGIVKGVSATEFAPDREVLVSEFVTMAVRALGAGTLVDSEGTWPTNYVNFANEEGILDDVNAIYTATATRMNAATIVANTLEKPMWIKRQVTTTGEITWTNLNSKTILEDLKISVFDDTNAIKVTGVSNKDNVVTYDDGTTEGSDIKTVENLDLTGIKTGLVYDYWTNKDGKIIGIWETEAKDFEKVEFTQIVKVTKESTVIKKVTLMVDGKEKEYKVADAGLTATENEATLALAGKMENTFGTAYIEGGKLASIYAETYKTMAVVKEVKTKSVVFESYNAAETKSALHADSKIEIDNEKFDYFITKNGKSIDVKDLEKGDVVAFYYISGKKYVGEVLSPVVEGKVSAKSTTKNTIKIDGTTYDVVAGFLGSIDNDSEIEAYATRSGQIALIKVVEDAAGDIAIIKSCRKITDKYSAGAENNLEVVLYFMDGTTSDTLTVDLEETKKELGDDGDTLAELYALYSVGKVCCYSISGDKITFKKVSTDKEYLSKDAKTLTVRRNSADIDGVEVDENTKFFKVKVDTDKTYQSTIEKLSLEDLDTLTLGTNSYIAEINYDNSTAKYAGVVVLGDATVVNRVSDTNFVFVTNYFEGKEDKTIDGYNMKGEPVSYSLNKDDAAYSKFAATLIGKVYDFEIADELVVDVKALAGTGTAVDEHKDDQLKDEFNPTSGNDYTSADHTLAADDAEGLKVTGFNSTKTLAKFGANTVAFADDVLVLKYNKADNEYSVKSVDSLNEYVVDEENTVVVDYVTYTNVASDKDTEVVAVVYMTLK